MKAYLEKARELPVSREIEVLVAGGGTAGAVAAIAAARNGARTLVIDQWGFLGGTQSGALVTPMMPVHLGGQSLVKGIHEEINQRLLKTGDAARFSDGNTGWYNPEMLKFVLEEMVLEAGAEILYHTWISDAIVEGRVVRGIIVENKSGRAAIFAERTIDCTGDADVAAKAGVPFQSGRPEDGVNQPMALRFLLGNVNLRKATDFFLSLGRTEVTERPERPNEPLMTTAQVWGKSWPLEPLFRKAVQEGVLREEDGDYFQIFTVPGRPGEVAFNCPRLAPPTAGIGAEALSYAQVEGRRRIRRLLAFCRTYLPGFEQAYLVMTAPMVGVRDSRRTVGDYVLTAEDILQARKFEDAIARNNYPIDIHRAGQSGAALTYLKPGEYHEIPYRCLLPRNVENLLVAGRCVSATFEAQASIRVQAPCRAMGQAAGTAAALSVRRHLPPRALNGVELRRLLREQGANV